MAAMMYAALQDPKGAGLLFLVLGLFLVAAGLWFALVQGGTLLWIVVGGGCSWPGPAGCSGRGSTSAKVRKVVRRPTSREYRRLGVVHSGVLVPFPEVDAQGDGDGRHGA